MALRLVPATWLLAGAVARRQPSLPLERIAWLLGVARRHSPIRATCLTEALVLARLLRAEGVEATVRIGVARQQGRLRAHAWVEHGGQAVVDSRELTSYAPLGAASARAAGARRAPNPATGTRAASTAPPPTWRP